MSLRPRNTTRHRVKFKALEPPLTSCDFVGDSGCSDPKCQRCHPLNPASTAQPMPTPNDRPAIADLVMADVKARDKFGAAKYGTRLQPHNGRDVLMDAYQEALDLAFYLRQVIEERDNP